MFRRTKEQEPEPVLPMGNPVDSGVWRDIQYNFPNGYLESGVVRGVFCETCRAPVSPSWILTPGGLLMVPSKVLCPKCGGK